MSNIFKLCPTHFSRGGEKNFGGCFDPLVTGLGQSRDCEVPKCTIRSWSLLCLQRQVAKLASGLLYYWSLLRNNNAAINLQMCTSTSSGSRRSAVCDRQGSHQARSQGGGNAPPNSESDTTPTIFS